MFIIASMNILPTFAKFVVVTGIAAQKLINDILSLAVRVLQD